MAKDYLKRLEEGEHHGPGRRGHEAAPPRVRPLQPGQSPADRAPWWSGTAFGLDVGKRSGILDTKEGIYFIQALAHTKADSAKFVKQLDQYRARASASRPAGAGAELPRRRSAESAKVVDNREKVLQQAAAQDRSLGA